MEYRVRWEIDVEADNMLEAAREALRLMQKPDTTANVFYVKPLRPTAKGTAVLFQTVDLGEECAGCDLDCKFCGVHQSDYEALGRHLDDKHNGEEEQCAG